ncbi:hypothetical protein KIW84_011331 [Lathyrus oleraceus]|uniref:Uncharacterized protein n=1 Tax=Pisum sativum TaxID=3888 RepID=A0A9D5BAV4_PEA|nr:hypothetical protein KIW84_011331 [Pisum sativum]
MCNNIDRGSNVYITGRCNNYPNAWDIPEGDVPEGNVEAARARALVGELKKKKDPAEFPGGPKDTSVLASYKAHIARYVYKGYHRLQLVHVSHRKKMRELAALVPDEQWFRDRVQATGLADLAKTGYEHLDPCSRGDGSGVGSVQQVGGDWTS